MTYEKLVAKVKTAYAKADASKITEHVAIQVNVFGESEGIFYIEINDGKVAVEPYDYVDHDMVIFGDEKNIVSIATGKVTIDEALKSDLVSVAGPNIEKGLSLRDVVVKKAAAKKAPAKKATTAKKAETKTAAPKKAAAKKAPAKKETTVKKAEATTAKKVEAKVEVKAAEVKEEVKAPSKKAETKAAAPKKAAAKKTK